MTFLSYTSGIPNAPNNPSVDQPPMKVNNDNNATIWTQDHFGFQNNAGGYHKQVHMKNQAAPGGLGANSDGVLYANTIGGASWPLWQNATASYQLAFTNTATQNNGQAFFPGAGGIIVKWGFVNSTSLTGSVVFVPAFPTNLFNVQFTSRVSSSSNNAGVVYALDGASFTKTGFTWFQAQQSTSGTGFYWYAIGN